MITFINSFGKHFSFHFFQEYMYTFNKTLAFFVIIFLSNYFIKINTDFYFKLLSNIPVISITS